MATKANLLPQDAEERSRARNYASHAKAKAGHKRAKAQRHGLLRELVREQRRFDIFVKHVLHLDPREHHDELMEWQDSHDEGLCLAWRGAAKTTYLTEARAVFEIIVDPNVRILLASDAQNQSKDFLHAIKSYLTSEEVMEIFGDFKTGAEKWRDDLIIVSQRTSVGVREPTVMCTGMDTVLPSRHFDIIIVDDLVTEENSRTEGQRLKTNTYWYKTLHPCLRQRGGRLWVIGTRYHEGDLYGWLAANDFKDATIVMGVLDDKDNSRWEAEFPTPRMNRLRGANLGVFELQYMCVTGKLLGGVFSPDHFVYIDDLTAVPTGSCFKWQGADLAIGQKSRHDYFAHVTLYMQRLVRNPYLVEWHLKRLKFPAQVSFCGAQFEKHPDTIRLVLERNAYQDALRQQVLEAYPDIPAVGQWTIKDKLTRADQRALFLTNHPLRVLREHENFVRLLCGFPDRKGSKDAFDALDITIARALRGARKREGGEDREEVGLI